MKRLRIISATRCESEQFPRATKLGLSMPRLRYDPRIVPEITFSNTSGLSEIYNRAIARADDEDVLLFVHDDVFIDDFNLFIRIEEALTVLDIVGLAGIMQPDAAHAGWLVYRDPAGQLKFYPQQLLSGVVGHFRATGINVCGYGLVPRRCALLDGCFLATTAKRLRAHNLLFDERFKFDFYDVDFCRTALSAGLRLGTWPIAVTHASAGQFGSPRWNEAYALYVQKWADSPPISIPVGSSRD
jgi:GT2 family glycosyltransferase